MSGRSIRSHPGGAVVVKETSVNQNLEFYRAACRLNHGRRERREMVHLIDFIEKNVTAGFRGDQGSIPALHLNRARRKRVSGLGFESLDSR